MDEDDWNRLDLGRYRWNAKRQGDGKSYVICNVWNAERKLHVGVRMHRLILDAPPHLYVDHINGDPLDNRRENLRLCTNAENQQNSNARRGSSQFKGVSWVVRKSNWRVAFNWQRQTYFVGYFDDELEAAKAYNAAILPLAGEFARVNAILQ